MFSVVVYTFSQIHRLSKRCCWHMAFSALRRAAERSSKLCCGMVETAGVWTISLKGNGYKRTIQKHTFGFGGWRIQYENGAIRCVTYSTRFLLGTLYVLYVFVYKHIYIYIFVYLRIVWNGDNEGLCGGRSQPHCQQTAMTSWACIPDKQT